MKLLKFRKRSLACLLPVIVAAATVATQANAIEFGANIHIGAQTSEANTQVAQVMAHRNLKIARMDAWGWADSAQKAMMRDQISKINASGGKVQLIIHSNRAWTNACSENLATVEQDEYNKAYATVGYYKDLVKDFEVLNEVQLDPYIQPEVPWNQQGDSTAGYYGKPCVARMTAVIKGITRAIRAHGPGSRVITGVIGRDYGWLSYLRENGIDWDVTGTHVYLGVNNNILTDTYFGSLKLFPSLARFGKPITINEFNCNEIYLGDAYRNVEGDSITEQCVVAVKRRLDEIKTNTYGTIESVVYYELWDQPQNRVPDNHWGLVYDLNRPKVNLLLASAYAGGNLSPAEQYEVTRRGLLSDAEIASMKQGGTQPAPQPASTQGEAIPPGNQLVDATGVVWTVSGGVISRAGVPTSSSGVTLVLYWGNAVYHQNAAGSWWKWENGGWVTTTDPRTTSGPTESANGAAIPSSSQLIDSVGATWTVSGGVIYRNGVQTVSSGVALLLYSNKVIYQQNSAGGWWKWESNGWVAAADPRVSGSGSGDSISPTVSISSPAAGATFARGATITVSVNASDNVGVSKVEFWMNGGLVCADNAAPYSCQVTLKKGRNTAVNLQARAFDAAGNTSSSAVTVYTGR